MLCLYDLKAFSENINELKVNDDGITPMENFADITTYITLKNRHTQGCPVYVLDERFQGNLSGIPKCKTHSRAVICLGLSPFNVGSVTLVLNPETGHVSPQFHVVFDD